MTSASSARAAASRAPRGGLRVSPASPAVETFRWNGATLLVLEQRDLPHKTRYIPCRSHADAALCIRQMSVRGAPAIGCVAAYGLALASKEKRFKNWPEMKSFMQTAKTVLAATRPTAVNLFWALERMERVWTSFSPLQGFQTALAQRLAAEAQAIHQEDLAACRRIGGLGADLLPAQATVLTHCNAGALATAGYGTALGVVRSGFAAGKIKKVLVDETRPYLQGARLTAWELESEKIPYEVITDNMAGHLMKTEEVAAVIVGADRIAANGDTANKIGTYSLSILAKHHQVPFYVAAPLSTIDLKTASGDAIPIEERSSKEVTHWGATPLTPKGAKARHPAFDVTPSHHITAIVTDRGVARAPYGQSLAALFTP